MNSLEPHFLQSRLWEEFQNNLGRDTIDKKHKSWQYMAIVEHGKLSDRLYCPYGPVAKDKKSLKSALSDLKSEAVQRELTFVRVEPKGNFSPHDLKNMGLVKSHHNVQPSHTVVNDVSKPPEEIMADLSQTARRYARKSDKAGVTYSLSYEPTDIKYFIELIHNVAQRTGMKPMSDLYFKVLSETLFPTHYAGLLFAELGGKKIAAIIFYLDGKHMYYAHAANDSDYRNISPAYGLGRYALLFAHEHGCQKFDWYGVSPEGASKNHRWAGFTQFKLSFGGDRKSYLGTWELPVKKTRYRLYKIILKLTGKA
jgi:lipid II:glycine glycyltransferase (peptidoglycan interpeptide bridge formation enzyme)